MIVVYASINLLYAIINYDYNIIHKEDARCVFNSLKKLYVSIWR